MADNDHRTKHKNTPRGILKRAHDSSMSKEDDDNPIKSILKKSKKQKAEKLDSFTEVEPKLHSVLIAKTSSRIASQVTVVNEQKTPSKNDKATTGASPKKSPSEKKQTEANMINKETKHVMNVSPSKTDTSKVSENENKITSKKPIVQKELDKDEVLSEKREKRNNKKENKTKKEKLSQDHESKLSIKKKSTSKDKSVKVELKVEEQDEEDDDEIGI